VTVTRPFSANLYPWLEQVAGVPRTAITPLRELPDRMFFEDQEGAVLRVFLANNPIVSSPANHGSWVVMSCRWKAAPSAQLCVCRRLDAATGKRDLFYEIDFDFAPWTGERLDWAAKHAFEVLVNKLTNHTTDQDAVMRRLVEAGVVFV
jgi:hypothetical protein